MLTSEHKPQKYGNGITKKLLEGISFFVYPTTGKICMSQDTRKRIHIFGPLPMPDKIDESLKDGVIEETDEFYGSRIAIDNCLDFGEVIFVQNGEIKHSCNIFENYVMSKPSCLK